MFKNAKIIARGVDSRAYHQQEAERGTPGYKMSPSALKEFLRCPARWKAGYAPPKSQAQDWGTMLDSLVLTPELFHETYVPHPETYTDSILKCPSCGSVTKAKKCRECSQERERVEVDSKWTRKAEYCSKWEEAAKANGFTVISPDTFAELEAAAKRLCLDKAIAAFLDCSYRQVLVEAEWHDPDTGLVIPVRCLIDLEPRTESVFTMCLGDLKTGSNVGFQFERHAHKYGYHTQAAFDLDLYVAATGDCRLEWRLLCQENFPPYQVGRKILSSEFVQIGRDTYKRGLAYYAWCVKNDRWPDYDQHRDAIEDWSVLVPDPWMEGVGPATLNFEPMAFADDVPETEPEESLDLIP